MVMMMMMLWCFFLPFLCVHIIETAGGRRHAVIQAVLFIVEFRIRLNVVGNVWGLSFSLFFLYISLKTFLKLNGHKTISFTSQI